MADSSPTTRAAIEQLLYLMDEAFEGEGALEGAHSFLANLISVNDDDWFWLPPGGGRCIFDIVAHVGECKYVYDSHAFGDGSMRWDRTGTVPTVERRAPQSQIVDWLREGHRRFRQSVASLADDSELLQPRKANWGESYETRWLIATIIEHDLYHAGEINHIRALRQGNDRWAWEA